MLKRLKIIAAILLVLFGSACSKPNQESNTSLSVRIGYFPNITHSQALVGMARGDYQRAIGTDGKIVPIVFNAGPSVIEAIFANELDLAYIGPNPAINGFLRSRGERLAIIAGATSGGASLVVRPGVTISSPKDLAKKRLASPQLGNTQDVALRAYIGNTGLKTREKGGTVEVLPMPNPQIIDLFRQQEIHGAWVPEPWATRLVLEYGGTRLVDERDLWPDKQFVTTLFIVRKDFLQKHADLVSLLLKAHLDLTQWVKANSDDAQKIINSQLESLNGKGLTPATLKESWRYMEPTWDPQSSSLQKAAEDAYQLGFIKQEPSLKGLFALDLLNKILRERNLDQIRTDS